MEDNENVIKKSYINLKLKFKKAKEMILFKDREIKIIEVLKVFVFIKSITNIYYNIFIMVFIN